MRASTWGCAAWGLAAASAAPALAEAPQPWQMGFQPAASLVMEELTAFHNMLLAIITLIVVFVLGLLLYVVFRFNERRSPTPSRTAHHTLLEVLWTAVPVLILVLIAIPSFRLLYYADRTAEPELTVKAIGHQWYWSYEYPDHGNFSFDAIMVPDGELQAGQLRLLETDNRVVLPVDTDIRLLVTADDVLHSWAMPAFGVKIDAVPGRINETWVRITREGVFYGQCSELCGVGHAYMPAAVEAVSKERFQVWVEEAKARFARLPAAELAAAEPAE